MTYKRFFKQCEEFSICGVIGDRAEAGIEGAENTSLYHIIIKGKGILCRPLETDYIEADADENNFVDEKAFMGDYRLYISEKPFHMYGFNPLKVGQDWDGKLVKESFFGDSKSYLICFNGSPVVNGIEMQRMDYALLQPKEYKVEINDGVLGMFTKKNFV